MVVIEAEVIGAADPEQANDKTEEVDLTQIWTHEHGLLTDEVRENDLPDDAHREGRTSFRFGRIYAYRLLIFGAALVCMVGLVEFHRWVRSPFPDPDSRCSWSFTHPAWGALHVLHYSRVSAASAFEPGHSQGTPQRRESQEHWA